jgi:SulP family sulfate permease
MPAPKLLSTLRGYTRAQFTADLLAGTIVGVVALPLAIAFAIASGVSPAQGLWTAIVAGFLISALGGSRVQIGGPTGAFVPIVAAVLAQHGPDGLLAATLLAGVMLVVAGALGAGAVIKFVPHPVITGFTTGIAVLIASTQVRDLLGLRLDALPAEFLPRWGAYLRHLDRATPAAIAVAAATLVILVAWPRVSRRLPAPFVALIATSVVTWAADLPVETIGSRFGAIPATLPTLHLPLPSLTELRLLLPAAFTIALLGGIESLLSAAVADGMIGGRHRANVELVAQGIANIASPIVGGLPATGAIARTATNVRNGGRTPVAGIVHAAVLLGLTLLAGPLAARIPLATLAGILVMVAYHMSEWRVFRAELRAPRGDVAVLLVTFVLTVLVDLTVALQAGMLLAVVLFVHGVADTTQVQAIATAADAPIDPPTRPLPDGLVCFEITGPLFFGAADRFRETLGQVAGRPRALILRLGGVSTLDATGIKLLADLAARCRREGTLLLLAEAGVAPRAAISRSAASALLPDSVFRPTMDDAIEYAARQIGAAPHAVDG